MGKHTKFDESDDDTPRKEEKSRKEHKKRDRSRSPRERSPQKERKNEREDYKDRRRNDDRRNNEWRGNDRRDGGREDYRRRDNNRGGNDRRSDFGRRDQDKDRLSKDEIAAQRKALWGNKPKPDAAEGSSHPEQEEAPVAAGTVAKNEKLWSSAIAASGVEQDKQSKFMRLMGVKNAPKPADDKGALSDEKKKQEKMRSDLDKQYAIARESTHMGRGSGFGFH